MQRDLNGSGDSDTIKRAPKALVATSIGSEDPTTGVNSILRTNMSNTYFSNRHQALLSAGPPERRSASPSPMATSFRAAIPFLHSGRLGAPVKSPSSVSSEPAIYSQQDQRFGFPPPPPPPRSSSKNAVGSSLSPKAASDIVSPSSTPTSMTYRSEFEKKQRFFSNGAQEKSETPAAIVQTNAVDEEPRFVKSASSSESINSQDGQRRRLLGGQTEPDKPPPPPPPRNKQEMLEQRQHELLTKQPQNRFVKFQLPDGHRLAAE